MVYYFSATGNSKHAAEVIAAKTGDTAVSIADILNGRAEIKEKNGKTGFVFPVYFWGLPEIIKRFASLPEVKNSLGDYVYCVITCGATTGTADKMLAKRLGRKLDYSFSLKMPDNYVVLYDPSPKEKAKKFLAHADKELETVCEDINSLAKKRAGSTAGELKSLFVPHLYDFFRTTKKFYADDKCTSCGLCAKNCPDGAIEMKNGKPVWIKSKCQHCTACINRCPTEAVQFGKGTQTRRRYNYDKTIK
ncbi:MAG: EFR1 family ferrodoxin [Clostridia bacterium]|nr:EFR1 family ferrodoxin [Clostridia bacterium]